MENYKVSVLQKNIITLKVYLTVCSYLVLPLLFIIPSADVFWGYLTMNVAFLPRPAFLLTPAYYAASPHNSFHSSLLLEQFLPLLRVTPYELFTSASPQGTSAALSDRWWLKNLQPESIFRKAQTTARQKFACIHDSWVSLTRVPGSAVVKTLTPVKRNELWRILDWLSSCRLCGRNLGWR